MINYPNVTRVEVIDETGRAYVKYLEDYQSVCYDLQDNNRTLKLFINKVNRDIDDVYTHGMSTPGDVTHD